ncbi:PTS sugar transporter subunit IIB [Ileibacterium valens]|uniref:PTS sugar transporter subunit IIB n=1 Tax=Ileibacterium valens TaxID=1862668 RepID=UPI00259BCCF2|nr:PTS sugar transporter subunit IIB [Ileibacterium valens]
MKKILLAYSSGMSTSLLVNKMIQAAKDQGIEAEIWAVGQSQVPAEIEKADIILFGPQMRFLKKKFEGKAKELNIPIDSIAPVLYGRCDGAGVLKTALDLIDKNGAK